MKRKIFYTLSFVVCLNLYATSREFSATGKKEETVTAARLATIKEQQQNKELATGFPLIHLFHEMS